MVPVAKMEDGEQVEVQVASTGECCFVERNTQAREAARSETGLRCA